MAKESVGIEDYFYNVEGYLDEAKKAAKIGDFEECLDYLKTAEHYIKKAKDICYSELDKG